MKRRTVLRVGAGVSIVGLAGCLHSDPLEEDELDDIDSFLEDGILLVEEARGHVTNWEIDPSEEDVPTFEELAGEARSLHDDFVDDIEPLFSSVEDSEIIRTVEDEEWTIEGEDMRAVLEGLGGAVESTAAACEAIVDANGDPEEMDEEARDTVERYLEESSGPVEDARLIWFEGGL